jgi:hypothetical protein
MTLVEKLHEIHASLTAAGLRHAFGGAIALAYCTLEPRGTRDLDVNIFTDASNAEAALAALPGGVKATKKDLALILRDGQARVWWDDTPIDLFLNNHAFHETVADAVRWVPLGGRDVPVLDCVSLTVFKALFNRTKDWADLEAVAEADPDSLRAGTLAVARLIGDDDQIVARLRSLV